MGLISIFLIGIGLSMDAFAAAICQGLCMGRHRLRHGLVVALFFGGFQGLMPWLGYQIGSQFSQFVGQIDHWIAFVLLVYLGYHMIQESRNPPKETATCGVNYLQLLGLSVATSLDAFAVGVTFAFLQVEIYMASAIIACTTFFLSLVGVMVGHLLGQRCQSKAQWTGGVVLIVLGCRILLESFL